MSTVNIRIIKDGVGVAGARRRHGNELPVDPDLANYLVNIKKVAEFVDGAPAATPATKPAAKKAAAPRKPRAKTAPDAS